MSKADASFEKVLSHFKKIRIARQVDAVLDWDEKTMMPAGSSAPRAEQSAYIKTHVHELTADPAFLAELQALEAVRDRLDPAPAAAVRVLLRKVRRVHRVPAALVSEMAHASNRSYERWQAARREKDFQSFIPSLREVFRLREQFGRCVAEPGQTAYEGLLGEYEPALPLGVAERCLGDLRDRLLPLVRELVERRRGRPAAPAGELGQDAQESLCRWAAEAIGFDFNVGRLDISAHPFCMGIGGDTRMTTRFDERDWKSAFYATLHESGHGMYEQGLDRHAPLAPLREASGYGMHESQSRFWENQIGRSREFCEFLVANAPAAAAAVIGRDADALFRAVNRIEPDYIRVEADEATYNLHILLRFEIEAGLFKGEYRIEDLPAVWAEKISAYLGLKKPSDDLGVLQDIHWSVGFFGYFPTYTIGNLIAAQLRESMRGELDVPALVRRGEFAPIRDWLGRKVHARGIAVDTLDLVREATGRPVGVEPFVHYLRDKFTGL